MFVLKSSITIGSFSFSGVHNVRIESSVHTPVVMAVIKVPALATINNGNNVKGPVVTGTQFKEGDPVTIRLGYDNEIVDEFCGFVKSRDMNMPLEVVCEGYTWLLKRNKVNISKQDITLKDVLQEAVKGIDSKYNITIKCEADVTLNNVQINGCGMDVISSINSYTDKAVNCFFIKPDTLWCGYLMTPLAKGEDIFKLGKVSYRSGWNIFKNNTLKKRTTQDDPVQVQYSKKQSDGTKNYKTSDAFKKFARTHSKILNQVKNASALKQLADEKAYLMNYKGYEGTVETFLQPYVQPGFLAALTDKMFDEKDGVYLVESVETTFGIRGARRKVGLGALKGFGGQ